MVQLSELVAKASELQQLNLTIEQAEQRLVLLKQKASNLSEHIIPKMMEELGMTTFTLTGNWKVSVRPNYFGKVLDGGYEWLRDNEYGDIVKAKFEIPYDFTNPEQAEKIKAAIDAIGVEYKEKMEVHHMTMGAFLREQDEAGVKFPEDKIKVYPGKKTIIS